jgi:hypothetical protein
MALGWPACLLAARTAYAGDTGPERARPEGPLPPTVEDRVYLAVSRFEQGFHCAQSVLAAYADGGLRYVRDAITILESVSADPAAKTPSKD